MVSKFASTLFAGLVSLAACAADLPTIAVVGVTGRTWYPKVNMAAGRYSPSQGAAVYRHIAGTQEEQGPMADQISMALVRSRRFLVLERARLDKIMDEGRLAVDPLVDDSRAVALGKLAGARFVVTGSYSIRLADAGGRIELTLRAVNVETGVVVDAWQTQAKVTEGDAAAAIEDLMVEAGKKIDETVPTLACAAPLS